MPKQNQNDVDHSGHRIRLCSLVEKSGIDNVSKIQAVEFFLTYIFPRGDVNPLAHRLLDRFGNFANIIDASKNELMKVKGINERSAQKIKLFASVMQYYTTSKLDKKLNLDNTEEILNIIENLIRYKNTENVLIFAFDISYNLVSRKILESRLVDASYLNLFEFYDMLLSNSVKHFLVAHNHPGGISLPSPDDFSAQKAIEKALAMFGANLIDSLVVGSDGIYSQNRKAFLRKYKITRINNRESI